LSIKKTQRFQGDGFAQLHADATVSARLFRRIASFFTQVSA
jgi:hypothetical protein